MSRQLSDLCRRGLGDSPQAKEIARYISWIVNVKLKSLVSCELMYYSIHRQLAQKLHELKNRIQSAVVNRVVEDFIDITTPLKQFVEAVNVPEGTYQLFYTKCVRYLLLYTFVKLSLFTGTPGREENFARKAQNLQNFSNRAAKTARMVAAGGGGGNKKLSEALLSSANQVNIFSNILKVTLALYMLLQIVIVSAGKFDSSTGQCWQYQNALPL